MSAYNYITFAQARQAIADRLYDSAKVFWTDTELGLYLIEALRTFNALTGFWRGDFTFPTQQLTTWYDLTDTSVMPNTLRPLTVTTTQLFTLIEYHLLEPIVTLDLPWTGSAQFAPSDIIAAVARRRDEILSVTGCTISRSLIPAVAGRTQLPDSTIDIRRIAYLPSTLFPSQSPSVLWPEDTWGEQSFNLNYTITPAGTPFAYLQSTQPPIAFDVDVPPAYAGNYEVLTVNAGGTITPSTAMLLSIPDDWTDILKWGALSDLLSRQSNARDLPRAAYCEQRYRLGLAALAAAPALLALRLNNVPLLIDAVRSADLYNTSWQAATPGAPTAALQTGLNLIALAPAPDLGIYGPYGLGLYGAGPYGVTSVSAYSVTATVVANAPVPRLDTDPVQVSRDDLDVILDFCVHIAMFKCGGTEFSDTTALLQRFLAMAGVYNSKLNEIAEYRSMLYGLSQRESSVNPRMDADVSTAEATT